MSTLGYGMYGFNVVNANGETDSLPMCRLYNPANQIASVSCLFTEAVDEYGMLVPNQGASSPYYSAIRTLVSGLYEISYQMAIVGGGGTSVSDTQIYVDKATSFISNGTFSYNSTGGAYAIGNNRQSSVAGAITTASDRVVIFLEKDCYISLVGVTISGTAPSFGGQFTSDYLAVRCISTENSGKAAFQS